MPASRKPQPKACEKIGLTGPLFAMVILVALVPKWWHAAAGTEADVVSLDGADCRAQFEHALEFAAAHARSRAEGGDRSWNSS